MPERYGRCVCASEPLLRNTIIQQIVAGWEVTPAYHLPQTVTGHVRIGKPIDVEEPTQTPTLPDDTQVGPRSPEPTATPSDCTSSTSRVETDKNDTPENETQTQITSHTEPKTDVLALGSQALGNARFLV